MFRLVLNALRARRAQSLAARFALTVWPDSGVRRTVVSRLGA